jgi:hypothetical protein
VVAITGNVCTALGEKHGTVRDVLPILQTPRLEKKPMQNIGAFPKAGGLHPDVVTKPPALETIDRGITGHGQQQAPIKL